MASILFSPHSVKWQIIEHKLLSCSANDLLWYEEALFMIKASYHWFPMVDTDVTSPLLIKCRPVWQLNNLNWQVYMFNWFWDRQIIYPIYNWRMLVKLTCRWCLIHISADKVSYKKITELHWLDFEHTKYPHRHVINYQSFFLKKTEGITFGLSRHLPSSL